MKSFAAVLIFAITLLIVPQKSMANNNSDSEFSSADSLECLERLSVSALALEKKMYNHAIDSWRYLFNNCPGISTRIYSDGTKLFKHFIDTASDNEEKEAYIDTLLMVYDQRIEYFGDHHKYPEGWILGRKGVAITKYRRNNIEALVEANGCFEKSFARRNDKSEPLVLISWIQASKVLSEHGRISNESFLKNFINVYGTIADKNFQRRFNDGINLKIKNTLEKLFSKTELYDCILIEKIYEGRAGMASLQIQDLQVFMNVLEMAKCKETDFYTSLVEKNYELEPSAEAAAILARMFVREGRYNRSVKYYHEALNKSANDSLKAVYYYELAVITDGHFGKGVEARQYAKQASALLPTWGKPHLLMGSVYAKAASVIEGNELEQKAVYWAAVDQFLKAGQKDASCKEEAHEQIEAYSKYFPDKQTCFFHGLDEGQTFVVGDWINEPTTVRYR